jgi:hypothetical protein
MPGGIGVVTTTIGVFIGKSNKEYKVERDNERRTHGCKENFPCGYVIIEY